MLGAEACRWSLKPRYPDNRLYWCHCGLAVAKATRRPGRVRVQCMQGSAQKGPLAPGLLSGKSWGGTPTGDMAPECRHGAGSCVSTRETLLGLADGPGHTHVHPHTGEWTERRESCRGVCREALKYTVLTCVHPAGPSPASQPLPGRPGDAALPPPPALLLSAFISATSSGTLWGSAPSPQPVRVSIATRRGLCGSHPIRLGVL